MTTISHLPTELLKEIISRIPLKYTGAVRLTCKNWDALLRNQTFMRIGEEAEATKEGESRVVVLMDYNLHLMSIVFNGRDIDPSAEQKGKRISLNDNDSEIKISQVFHCDGLLLCVLKDHDKFRLVVWNPYWGQTRWIEPRYTFLRPDPIDRYSYALGYENKSGSHKILRFIDIQLYSPRHTVILWYEIYDVESNMWRTLDFTTPHWRITYDNLGISLKGNTYWCATKRKSDSFWLDHIVCFDFTSETFGPLLRLPVRPMEETLVTLSCVREENLAALYSREEGGIEVWITTKIEAEKVSWSKFLKVDIAAEADIPSSVSRLSFFIDEAKKVAMIFDKMCNGNDDYDDSDSVNIIGEAGYIRQVCLGEPSDKTSCSPFVCSYVPSLKQIKQPARGGKRKRQNSLEKHLYDQYMSRLVPHHQPHPFTLKRKQQKQFGSKHVQTCPTSRAWQGGKCRSQQKAKAR